MSRARGLLIPILASLMILLGSSAAWASTAAGTSITETMSTTYQDSSSNNYSATSNTVTTTVANVPLLTVAAGTSYSPFAPGDTAQDDFVLTNTGNGSGNFIVPSDAVLTSPATSTQGYVINDAASGTCSMQSPCTLVALNAQLALSTYTVAVSGTVTVGVEYVVSTSATAGQTPGTSLAADISYAAVSGAAAAISSNVSMAITDAVAADARLDLQATATTPANSGVTTITWTVKANNGGSFSVLGTQAAKTMFGASSAGVAIFDKLPTFGGSVLGLTGTPTISIPGVATGVTATLYYSTAATPATSSDWSTTYNANAKWLAVYFSAGSNSYTSGGNTFYRIFTAANSSSAGNVTTAQATLTFITNVPTGNSSGNPGSVTNMANALYGGTAWTNGIGPLLGTGIAIGQGDNASQPISSVVTNTTPSSGTTSPGGASNTASSNAYTVYTVALGSGAAVEVGAWSASTIPGYTSGTADTNHDFTFVGVAAATSAVNSATNPAGAPSGNTLTTYASTVIPIGGNLKNTGNADDTYTLSNNSVSGWTVTYYQANCTTALTSNQIALTSGSTAGICVKFALPTTVTAYTAYDFTITATSVGNGSVTDQLHDVLYPGGAIVLFKTYTVSGCPGGVTPANNGVISGCTITVTVTAVNEAPSATAGGGSATNTTFTGSNIVVTQNAAASGNTWGGSTTNGISAAPNLTSCPSCTTTGIAGSTNFTVTIPSLAAQASASFTYALVVK